MPWAACATTLPRARFGINIPIAAPSSRDPPTRCFDEPIERQFGRPVQPAIDAARTEMRLKSLENLFGRVIEHAVGLDAVTVATQALLRAKQRVRSARRGRGRNRRSARAPAVPKGQGPLSPEAPN